MSTTEIRQSEPASSAHYKNWRDVWQNINWINATILLGTPLVAIIGMIFVPLQWKTLVLSIIYYFFTGLGITAGYHRLWAHKAYQAGLLYRVLLLAGGTGALEGSVKWWCADHRNHHRYTDTVKDPYNASYGFLWCHMGWMLMKPDKRHKVIADIKDLNADPLIRFQHKHYLWLGPLMSFVLPSLIAWWGWDDFWGGYFYAGACRQVFVHHSTFCVNSVAHWLGSHTFDDTRSPRDHIFTAFCTLGEGYHNFHHEFPHDFRNGIRWYDYDPTKWLIKFCSFLGLTYGLKEFSSNEVEKGKVMMMQKKLDKMKSKLKWAPRPETLPPMSTEEMNKKIAKEKRMLVVVDGLVHDVTKFAHEHPGGLHFIEQAVGQDATARFNGGVYNHSNAARNTLGNMRIARLVDQVVN